MLIEIFRQSLEGKCPTLKMIFQRCQFEIKGKMLWIHCSDNYFEMLNACKPTVALWVHRSGFMKSVGFIMISTPEKKIHWL